jgi:hypothetical protein
VRNLEFEAQPTEFLPINIRVLLPSKLNSREYNNINIFNDIQSEIHVVIFYSSNSFGYHYPKSKEWILCELILSVEVQRGMGIFV